MITIVKLLVKPAPDNGDGKENDDFTDWMDQEALRIPAPPHFPYTTVPKRILLRRSVKANGSSPSLSMPCSGTAAASPLANLANGKD